MHHSINVLTLYAQKNNVRSGNKAVSNRVGESQSDSRE